MKKILIVFLTLVLVLPVIGYACDCCPPSRTDSNNPALAKVSHDCCPELNHQKDTCSIERQAQFIPDATRVLVSPAMLSVSFASNIFALVTNGNASSPPLLVSHAPLYLSNRVLRL